jgi:hypothetical protein
MKSPPQAVFHKVAENPCRLDSSGTYYALFKRAGKQIRRSLKTTDAALARRRLNELREKVERRQTLDIRPTKSLDTLTVFLLRRLMRFIRQHPLFRPATAATFLATNLFRLIALRGHVAFLQSLDLVEQHPARQETVHALLARGLAFHPQLCRHMQQHHARRTLVDVLSTVPAGTDKRLLNIRLAHAQCRHALRELAFLFHADGKMAHIFNPPAVRRVASPSGTPRRRKSLAFISNYSDLGF